MLDCRCFGWTALTVDSDSDSDPDPHACLMTESDCMPAPLIWTRTLNPLPQASLPVAFAAGLETLHGRRGSTGGRGLTDTDLGKISLSPRTAQAEAGMGWIKQGGFIARMLNRQARRGFGLTCIYSEREEESKLARNQSCVSVSVAGSKVGSRDNTCIATPLCCGLGCCSRTVALDKTAA